MTELLSGKIQVLLPLAVGEAFDYRLPEGQKVAVGAFVRVSFGRKNLKGVVWGKAQGGVPEEKIKQVQEVLPATAMPIRLVAFINWVAEYCLAPRGSVLAMAMSVPAALEPPPPQLCMVLPEKAPEIRLTPARQAVLHLLREEGRQSRAQIKEKTGVSAAVINSMVKQGALAEKEMARKEETECLPKDVRFVPVELSRTQQQAAQGLKDKVRQKAYSTTVLDGVTGSGKTEVYIEAIYEAMKAGGQALVLLPEIVLTAQLIKRFSERFGFVPALWHSGLTPAQRKKNWRAISKGEAQLIVGARSALFLPYPDLRLIVVDEEHEMAFKQEEGVIYHGRDMAIARAYHENIPVVLVSATPSLETTTNVESGKYQCLHLPSRHGGATLPDIEVVDMRQEKKSASEFISAVLREALAETLARGEQAMLFLNRRGYAPLTLCRKCGYRFQCPSCSAWLVTHRKKAALQCHHCGYHLPLPDQCPQCEEVDMLAACGPGVERVEEEVHQFLPQARVVVMTSDLITDARKAESTVKDILEGRVDIIIGTQLVAKGHHFPYLTLVGVVDADAGLSGGDLRAAEKSYQLMQQVAGRAGREKRKGRVMLQSYMPENAVIKALVSGDRETFMRSEAMSRKAGNMPPFSKLAAIVLAGKDEAQVKKSAALLVRAAPQNHHIEVFGPAPAPLSLLRGKYRWRLLVRVERNIHMQKMLKTWLDRVKIPASVRVKIDVDPYSFV